MYRKIHIFAIWGSKNGHVTSSFPSHVGCRLNLNIRNSYVYGTQHTAYTAIFSDICFPHKSLQCVTVPRFIWNPLVINPTGVLPLFKIILFCKHRDTFHFRRWSEKRLRGSDCARTASSRPAELCSQPWEPEVRSFSWKKSFNWSRSPVRWLSWRAAIVRMKMFALCPFRKWSCKSAYLVFIVTSQLRLFHSTLDLCC